MLLGTPKGRAYSERELMDILRQVSVCRDPKDDAYSSLCASIGADHLITGDKDLLAVDPAREPALPGDLKILTPREYLETD